MPPSPQSSAARCGEHEDHSRRRLLQDLEQRVPGLAGQHVGLVHDVDLVVPRLRGRIHGALPQLARVVHPPVARSVDLDHVEAGRSVPDAQAGLAFAARIAGGMAVGAVERHREDPSRGGFPHSARARQQVAMAYAAAGDRTAEHGGDMILHQQIGELLRTIAAGEGKHWDSGEGEWSAPGDPKRHRTSLSAATGEVLTRFTRRRPPDLGHPQYSRRTGGHGSLMISSQASLARCRCCIFRSSQVSATTPPRRKTTEV